MREMAVRTAGAAMSRGARIRTRAATGAAPPRARKWSPYTSKSAERAFTGRSPGRSLPHGADCSRRKSRRQCDNGAKERMRHRRLDPRWVESRRSRRRVGARMAAMKPRTGDGPLEVTKEGRGLVMRVPLEGGGRLVVELNAEEAGALGAALKEVVG